MSRWRPAPAPWTAIMAQLTQLIRIATSISDSQRTTNRKLTQLMTDQEHLDADVTAITASVATAVTALKAAIANGVPAEALDFSSLDALAESTAAEAAADAPAEPTT